MALATHIMEMVKIFQKSINVEKGTLDIPEDLKEKFNSLYKSIFDELLWYPGTLIYMENPNELRAAQATMDLIWETVDADDIFDEMLSGGYGGLLANVMGDYADRIKMLKPTFISVNPQNYEFHIYYEEAMKAWLFGLSNSSLIICCSILETMLRQELYRISIDLVYQLNRSDRKIEGVESLPLDILIENATKEKLISYEERKTAHRIRKLRNDAIHSLRQVTHEETYEAIINTKNLIEKLLAPTQF